MAGLAPGHFCFCFSLAPSFRGSRSENPESRDSWFDATHRPGMTALVSGVQLLQFLEDRFAHLRGRGGGGAFRLDVGSAQTAREHRGDRGVELVRERTHVE